VCLLGVIKKSPKSLEHAAGQLVERFKEQEKADTPLSSKVMS
jgi:hypothetical protein